MLSHLPNTTNNECQNNSPFYIKFIGHRVSMINSVALQSLAQFKPSCFPSFNRSKKLSNGQTNACHSLEMEIRNIPLFEPERKKNKDSTCIMQMKLTQHRRNWKQVQQGSLLTTQHSIKQALSLISKTAVNPSRNYRSILDKRTFRPSQLFALHVGCNSTTMKVKDDMTDILINKDVEILTVTKLASPIRKTNKKPKFFQVSPIKTKTSYKPISHIGNLKQLKEQKQQRQERQQKELRQFSRSATVYTSQQREKKEQKDQLEIRFYEQQSCIDVERLEDSSFLLEQSLNANSYVVVRAFNNDYTVLGECKSEDKVEIASLTKIMTCLLVLLVAQKLQISLKKTTIKVGLKASLMQGTSANLQYSDVISIHDLLHGLMLPSGNDAALALADWTGKAIRRHCNASNTSPRKISFAKLNQCMRTPIGLFIYHMNCLARSLDMSNTKFANCHGLANKKNVSSAYDLSKLCLFAMKREDFSKIVKVQEYTCQVNNTKFLNQRTLTWKNTNKLLRLQMAYGIKTGMTPSAGPCLASCFRISDSESIFIVLLNTLTAGHRFEESKKLLIQTMKNLYEATGDKHYLCKLQQILGNKLEIKPQQLAEDYNSMDIQEDEEAEEDQTGQYSESAQN